MELNIYKRKGKWIIENEKGQILQENNNSQLNDRDIIELGITLTNFHDVKVNINWTEEC